jgi:large subunit ribosomal protein L19
MKAQKLTKETIRDLGIQKRQLPDFTIGDTIAVSLKVKELDKVQTEKTGKEVYKERIQLFQGDVIARHKKGASSSFIVRKITNGVGVERIFPDNAPIVDRVEVVRKGSVRRAKLYYIRDRVGKSARIKEKKMTSESAGQANNAAKVSSTQTTAEI